MNKSLNPHLYFANESVRFTVVIPVHDEAENIIPLAEDISRVMEETAWRWECLWVDDGSQDETLETLRALHARDARHR